MHPTQFKHASDSLLLTNCSLVNRCGSRAMHLQHHRLFSIFASFMPIVSMQQQHQSLIIISFGKWCSSMLMPDWVNKWCFDGDRWQPWPRCLPSVRFMATKTMMMMIFAFQSLPTEAATAAADTVLRVIHPSVRARWQRTTTDAFDYRLIFHFIRLSCSFRVCFSVPNSSRCSNSSGTFLRSETNRLVSRCCLQ